MEFLLAMQIASDASGTSEVDAFTNLNASAISESNFILLYAPKTVVVQRSATSMVSIELYLKPLSYSTNLSWHTGS